MYYDKGYSYATYDKDKIIVVDLRSDTLTKPTQKMREALSSAEVGDDGFHEDPTVKVLQETAAKMVGMEDALFVCSGTMANLIAIMNHCNVRGCEAYCGDSTHTLLHEQCGAVQIGGVSLRSLRNNIDGTFDLSELRSKLRHDINHEPISKLVIVENTINGKIVPLSWLKELVSLCKEHNLKLHMDGARLWNASVESGISGKEIVSGFDSVTFCLSKGLGAPVGSVLCGSKDFITSARRIRKVLGGDMRQVGILAAAGLVALENIPRLVDDHRRAYAFASALNEIQSSIFSIDLSTVHTNIVFLNIESDTIDATKFIHCLLEFDDAENEHVVVKCLGLTDSLIRNVKRSVGRFAQPMACYPKVKNLAPDILIAVLAHFENALRQRPSFATKRNGLHRLFDRLGDRNASNLLSSIRLVPRKIAKMAPRVRKARLPSVRDLADQLLRRHIAQLIIPRQVGCLVNIDPSPRETMIVKLLLDRQPAEEFS